MCPQRLCLIALGVAAALLLAGCGPDDIPILQAVAPAEADVFGAQQVPASANDTIVIEKAIEGPISVVAYPPASDPARDEVAIDYIVVGQGNNQEAALQAARQHTVELKRGSDNRVYINVPQGHAGNRVQPFVRVPEKSSLIIDSPTGDTSIPAEN